MESLERRLPVYLLLDCSESMVGEGIEGVNAGVRQLLLDLFSDPHALETVWVSIITFADTATQLMPLTELADMKAPHLKVRPGTSLGAALKLLRECIAREVRVHSAIRKGDWKPMVFLLTDGTSTDEWRAEATLLKEPSASGAKKLNLIAIGCGEDVDSLALIELTDSVLMMGDTPGDFRSLFQWISSSLSITSQALATPGKEAISLSKVPEGFTGASPNAIARHGSAPSQLFLSLRCSETRKPYLTRFYLDGQIYRVVRAHIVDEDYFSGQTPSNTAAMQVSSERILGVAPCPHCGNRAAGQCPNCGQLFCAPDHDSAIECPHCTAFLSPGGDGGEFSLSGRLG